MTAAPLDIGTPKWFRPHLEEGRWRYHAIHSGRGAGKSTAVAEDQVEKQFRDRRRALLCVREVQKSLDNSVKKDLEVAIAKFALGGSFVVQESTIKSVGGPGLITFVGMLNHTADSIKSYSGYDAAWVEEAQSLSRRSLDVLMPTIRRPMSTITFTWNPRYEDDPVDELFRCNSVVAKERGQKPPENALVTKTQYDLNPWFEEPLISEMLASRARSVHEWARIWCGEYETATASRVFSNFVVEEFETPPDAVLYFGADWGFARDPTCLVRCFIVGRNLYVDHEASMVGCEIVDTPALFATIPESSQWPIVADSARPETISHLRRNGFPKMMGAIKGAKSVEEGIEFLRGFKIIVHPRCTILARELVGYRFKVDPRTLRVTPRLDDGFHVDILDALRYAVEGVRRAPKPAPTIHIPTVGGRFHTR